jgi:hypothetical protein
MSVEGTMEKRASRRTVITEIFAIAWATVREIFDESAYSRFLSRNHMESSPQAYAAFRRENETAKMRRARCC